MLKFNPHDRFKTKLVQNSRSGNFMDTDRQDIDIKKTNKDNRVFEQDDVKKKIKISKLEDLFKKRMIDKLSKEESLELLKGLINKYHDKELENQPGHVRQVWEDGEITLQKSGSLLWQRSLHQMEPGLKKSRFNMPIHSHEDHSYANIKNEKVARLIRSIMAEAFDETDDSYYRIDNKLQENKMKKNKIREETQLKPERSTERPEEEEISSLDAEMFENIKRDLIRLNSVVSKTLEDVRDNKGQHYDEYILKLKRIFEPLVVTMQKLPDHKDELGKEEPDKQDKSLEVPEQPEQPESPEDYAKKSVGSLGGTELDKEIEKQKNRPNAPEESPEDAKRDLRKNKLAEQYKGHINCSKCGGPVEETEENMGIAIPDRKTGKPAYFVCKHCAIKQVGQAKYNQIAALLIQKAKRKTAMEPKPYGFDETKTQTYVDKVALKTRTGRIVWVKRAQAPKYIAKKGYSIASGVVPRSKRKKSSKPHKTLKKAKFDEGGSGGLYTGSGTHLVMPQDKQEMIEGGQDSKRYIMRGPNNKTYAVRKEKCQKYLDKGFTLEKDNVTKMPKNLTVNETRLSKIVKEELSRVVEEITKKELKALKK